MPTGLLNVQLPSRQEMLHLSGLLRCELAPLL